jgi:hypothetical protein
MEFPFRLGQSWSNNKIDTDSIVVTAIEQVRVPTGKLVPGYRLTEEYGLWNEYVTVQSWFVPGMGMVRREIDDFCTVCGPMSQFVTLVLESYSPPAGSL